jgi:hypothetical protein
MPNSSKPSSSSPSFITNGSNENNLPERSGIVIIAPPGGGVAGVTGRDASVVLELPKEDVARGDSRTMSSFVNVRACTRGLACCCVCPPNKEGWDVVRMCSPLPAIACPGGTAPDAWRVRA